MSEAPRWGSGGLCSNRLDEFSMTGTADALNRPEFHRLRDLVRRSFLARLCPAAGPEALWPFDGSASVDAAFADDIERVPRRVPILTQNSDAEAAPSCGRENTGFPDAATDTTQTSRSPTFSNLISDDTGCRDRQSIPPCRASWHSWSRRRRTAHGPLHGQVRARPGQGVEKSHER